MATDLDEGEVLLFFYERKGDEDEQMSESYIMSEKCDQNLMT